MTLIVVSSRENIARDYEAGFSIQGFRLLSTRGIADTRVTAPEVEYFENQAGGAQTQPAHGTPVWQTPVGIRTLSPLYVSLLRTLCGRHAGMVHGDLDTSDLNHCDRHP
jgi:hypothetical protein